MAKKIKYKVPYIVHTQFERDRQNIWVEDAKGRNVAEWWDEEVSEMVEDGFFNPRNLAESVIRYLVDTKFIDAEQMSGGFKKVWVLPDFSEEQKLNKKENYYGKEIIKRSNNADADHDR